ncbi:MAG: Na+/H+ antiporter subunit E [Thiobacillus sp.]|uniref:Na+/H+ antiporter subunit E n=1 Tax=Thiobacillus sp. TaxID=924 RepID=UPI0027353AE8|nr:Na+/H+ antiporter subunit E [Thiobacillus sp.]MDP3586333.1 Na+/H+ antiporter subunit E [Thiobacillus sp.]
MKLTLATVRAVLWRSALFAVLWWALTDGRPDSWGVGSVSVAFATTVSIYLLPPVNTYVSRIGLLRFLVFFIVQSLRGGAQVAGFALRPRMGLRPGFHEIDLRLPEGIGRVLLANTLSLLPGTLSVELQGNRLCLHVLDERAPTETEVRAAESRLADLLGLTLHTTG